MFSYQGELKFEVDVELLTHAEWRPVPEFLGSVLWHYPSHEGAF